jgi:type I restriction enzyme S subunit
MQDVISGTTRDSLNLRDLRLLEIPIPPLAEQRRIVAAVDTLFARINATRERLRRALSILKRFRRAVLATACSGRATADWRKEHPESQPPHESDEGPFDLPEPWKWVRFGKLLQSLRSGSTVPPQNEPTAFPILRSSSVRPGFVDLQDVRYLKEEDSDNADNYLREGDLLFTRLSGSLEFVGNCARVPPLAGKAIQYPDRLFCAKLADPSQGCYFVFAFAAPFVREELTKGAKSSAGHQRISMSNITKQTVPLPSLAEQNEVVRRVDALYALADRIEAKLAAARRRVERLTQAVLTKAFRGELVPTEAELARREGRDYEPASVLLERIRAERERQPDGKARKGRHGRQSGKKER